MNVLLAGVFAGLLPVLHPGRFRRNLPGLGLVECMLLFAAFGSVAAWPLVLRDLERNKFWAEVVGWVGILAVTALICVLATVFLSD